jgi:hypothetical protein
VSNILPPACNPRIRHIRFNFFTGRPLAQHRMDELVEDMRLSARQPGADPRLAAGYVAARECRRLVATNS